MKDKRKPKGKSPAGEKISTEEKLAREAIREVLESQDRADIICMDIQQNGMFTPFITIDGHTFKSLAYYGTGVIGLEMYERLSLKPEELEEFREKVEKADKTFEPKAGEEKSMRMGISKKPEHLSVFALVHVKEENGKEKMVEDLRSKLSGVITTVSMLYFGMFDGPDDATETDLTPKPTV